ncbi:MAG TPA: alpha/beta hydrolase [Roseateles sp.]|nr:alpha/beta hydrolase [Roseateles sp.]
MTTTHPGIAPITGASTGTSFLSNTGRGLRAAALSLGLLALACGASADGVPAPQADIGIVDIGDDFKLRRLVVRPPHPKGTVLLLHGFPETLYTWRDIALTLGRDYEVHAFDWPGYGLSSRPPVERFSYSPRDYAKVLKGYIDASGIDTSRLLIYGTDIGGLPALLLALERPDIASTIVVGDFAPLDRPQHMAPNLQGLKSAPSSEAIRAHLNRSRDEIVENAYRRGFAPEQQFDISPALKDDMRKGWDQPTMSTADAFYHYYSHFTRDQNFLEANLGRLKTPIKLVWGANDFYIHPTMGTELAERLKTGLKILSGIGHYPHLQDPAQTIDEIRAVLGQRKDAP